MTITTICNVSTHEKMTLLGSRFFEKGRRSGSCLLVQSSMMHDYIHARAQTSESSEWSVSLRRNLKLVECVRRRKEG